MPLSRWFGRSAKQSGLRPAACCLDWRPSLVASSTQDVARPDLCYFSSCRYLSYWVVPDARGKWVACLDWQGKE
eukprot:974503-Pelagomonas_calceolata.AAC.1